MSKQAQSWLERNHQTFAAGTVVLVLIAIAFNVGGFLGKYEAQKPPASLDGPAGAIQRGLELHEPATPAERAIHERLEGMSAAEIASMLETMQLTEAAMAEARERYADDPERLREALAEIVEASGLVPAGGG